MKTPKLLGLLVSALFLVAPSVSSAQYEPECSALEEARDLALAEIDTVVDAEANPCTTKKQSKALASIIKAYTKSSVSTFKARLKIAVARKKAMTKLLSCESASGLIGCQEYNDPDDKESGCKIDSAFGIPMACRYNDVLSTPKVYGTPAAKCLKTFKSSLDKEKSAVVKFNNKTIVSNKNKYTKALEKLNGSSNDECRNYWKEEVKDKADDYLASAVDLSNCLGQWDVDNFNNINSSGKLVAPVPTPREMETDNGCPMPRPTATATPTPTATRTPIYTYTPTPTPTPTPAP